jgi:gamma-D-glutamyl-L-lysine dipeptidyl-peptidase
MTAGQPAPLGARIRTAIAPMHAEARITSPCVSQQLAGHYVDVLEEQDDWLRVRGADGYEGWIHTGYVARAPVPQARRSRETVRMSLGCVAKNPTGGERVLPLRALLAPEERVVSGEAVDTVQLARRFPQNGEAVAHTAQDYFHGTSYVWGGVTPWGADCSGMVSSVFALHGIPLPRDAWQQAEVGHDAGSDPLKVPPGTLLFFSERDDGRITHVGIAAGKKGMVHLALGRGGYAMERLDAKKDPYVETLRARFRVARTVV